MSSRRRPHKSSKPDPKAASIKTVESLLDQMREGNEYGSIVNATVKEGQDLVAEVVRALGEIEAVRGRPCISYLGNVVKKDRPESGVDVSDDLPFAEMVDTVPADQRSVDIVISTFGGSGEQISRFVNFVRARFDEVNFLVPSLCMSAGTLFTLSGDEIVMTDRAFLGPIDPQVPAQSRYVPAQALELLVKKIQTDGQDALNKGQPVPWSLVRILDTIDKKELAAAFSASSYSTMMASQFLSKYKFKNWKTRESSGAIVTDDYKQARAETIAQALASHERWKDHGHGISREVLWDEIQLKISHPSPELNVALKRFWALMYWIFDRTQCSKVMASQHYRFAKIVAQEQPR